MRTLIRDAEVRGGRYDVLLDDRKVLALTRATGRRVSTLGVDDVVEADGRALIPGLHDHHLHLMAMAAVESSLNCGPETIAGAHELRAALQRVTGGADAWLRAVNYHESVAGVLDRWRLDEWVPDRPVRVQHRSGALWMLNSAALRLLGPLPDTSDVERDGQGRPTGRLWRLDEWLGTKVPAPAPPDLRAIGDQLRGHGITGVTDATPDLGAATVRLIDAAVRSGALPSVTLLTALPGPPSQGTRPGPRKILLHDHDLPSFDELAARVEEIHAAGRSVAIHVVTRLSLVLTLAVLEMTGTLPGDRVEHGAVIPPELRPRLAELGLRVVTQPGFLRARGDDYLRDVEADDVPHLYPHGSLLDAGVRVALSSDAPYGPLDPWRVIATATHRLAPSGRRIGSDRDVSAVEALRGYLSPPDDPGGRPRRIAPGSPADLVLLNVPMRELADALPENPVARVWQSAREATLRSAAS